MRLVIDTNVIISGLLSKGPPGVLLRFIEDGTHELCLTPNILKEIKRVLHYPRIMKLLQRAEVIPEEVIEWLMTHSKLFEDVDVVHLVKEDPSDDAFINCALASGARVIISGDRHLLRIGTYQGIRIVSPANFLRKT